MRPRDPETWRAELDDGDLHEVLVWDETRGGLRGPVPLWTARALGGLHSVAQARSPHAAVAQVAIAETWPLRCVLAPGEATRAALVAQCDALQRALTEVTAERDALRKQLDDAQADFDSLDDAAAAVVRAAEEDDDLCHVSRKLRDALQELRDGGRDEWWRKTTEHRAPPSIALRAALAKMTAERDALRGEARAALDATTSELHRAMAERDALRAML